MFRGYDCFVGLVRDGEFSQCTTTACWSMLGNYRFDSIWGFPLPEKLEDIHINQFHLPETAEYQDLMVDVINEITPCSIEGVKGLKLIKYRVMGELTEKTASDYGNQQDYNRNLVLLNFIRNLWHEPLESPGYVGKFFKALEASGKKYKDPLQRLTWANKEACPTPLFYSPGHSNVHDSRKLKIKKTKQLLGYKFGGGFNSTCQFLTDDGE